ncbi:GNAT family N-acetyltransferase [Kitasatospora kifunensis]|uniref:GNAT superfamily N-acetyltransferase n=1 Tax=Kitasatospora kifunensis TaxID=58351 RepID=A0A7W7VYJ4_KITKI|nr:GNAT family N-acetyltransferase [Kitasatospora kifunensis]MBB4926759.1 GNAT superfamily N-acetyltransferase [Kitasatospora kifunensis]
MTTTLRPAGPPTATPDGGADRRWLICSNGRPVGTVRTVARRYGSYLVGRIEGLAVTDAARRRGRGTVAVLAAEEVLRAWGCQRAEVTVPVQAPPAHALALALGYTETNLHLLKRIGQPAQPASGLTIRPIGAEDFPDWLEATKAEFRAQLVRAGLTEEQARQRCATEHTRLLRQGHATQDVALRRLLADGRAVGSFWLALDNGRLPDGSPLAWVMTVDVAPELRGNGYGRELMLAAERECLAAGVRDLGLNVYSGNTVALGLYTSLDYRITHWVLTKTLL